MFLFRAELYCDSCGSRIKDELHRLDDAGIGVGDIDDGDSDTYPQYTDSPGASDVIHHCASRDACLEAVDLAEYGLLESDSLFGVETRRIGALLTDELTAEGEHDLIAMLNEVNSRTPYQRALHALWREAFPDVSDAADSERREAQQAMVFLDTWGSTSYPPERWKGFRWSEDSAPEWLDDLPEGVEPDACVSVLHCGFDAVKAPDGYIVVHQSQCGERECPQCSGKGHAHGIEGVADGTPCDLCEGNGYIYWGEEWSLVVFAPAWVVGAGQCGCLYDFGPERHASRDDAIESALVTLLPEYEFSARTRARVRRDLEIDGIHYFDRRLRPFVGHDYVEVSKP